MGVSDQAAFSGSRVAIFVLDRIRALVGLLSMGKRSTMSTERGKSLKEAFVA